MFKTPLWQTVWTHAGSTLFASILDSPVMIGSYFQQTTSADDIFRCIFLLGALRVKEHSKLRQIRAVCTLESRGLACNNMLRMLLYQIRNKYIESLSFRKRTLNFYLNHAYGLHA